MFTYRFEIVRSAPFMNNIYKILQIDAQIPGEGLEFQNITWTEFEVDYIRTLEIKGFIANITEHNISLPMLNIQLFNDDMKLLQEINDSLAIEELKIDDRLSININIKKPSSLTKYILLTFKN